MNIFCPASLDEFWSLPRSARSTLMAGGTDVLVRQRAAGREPDSLCCLERIPELREISRSASGLRLGAACTVTELLAHPDVTTHAPLLCRAMNHIGSPLVRNQATLGGNICTASPAGDSLPALYVLDARLELRTAQTTRTVPVRDFITGPGRTVLAEDELLTAILLPPLLPDALHHFEKVGQRRAQAIAVVSLAAMLQLEDGLIRSARLALGSVGPTVMTCPEAEQLLLHQPLTPDVLRRAAELVEQAVRPISDVRASAEYRRQVAGNLLLRLAETHP